MKLPIALSALAIGATAPLFLIACGDDATGADFLTNAGLQQDAAFSDAASSDAATTADVIDSTQPPVPEFGENGEGAIIAWVGRNDGLVLPRDLAFNPSRPGELWVFDRATDGVVIAFDAGTDVQQVDRRVDAFGNHFMEEVSAASFDTDGFFGTCQESRNTYNGQAFPNDFMGPALWTSDLATFAEVFQNPSGQMLGSHMDMLHQSPNCMGIEWDGGVGQNGYWVFDGYNGHLVYNDFREDHGPGADDHSDGVVRRYTEVELTRVPDVPGHLALSVDRRRLYIADTGADRVLWVNVDSGSWSQDLTALNEPLAEFSVYSGVEWGVVAEGVDQPSGIALNDERLFVGSYGSGEIIAYDLETYDELGRFDTQGEGLMGLEIGPDGRLWFVDAGFAEVTRIE